MKMVIAEGNKNVKPPKIMLAAINVFSEQVTNKIPF